MTQSTDSKVEQRSRFRIYPTRSLKWGWQTFCKCETSRRTFYLTLLSLLSFLIINCINIFGFSDTSTLRIVPNSSKKRFFSEKLTPAGSNSVEHSELIMHEMNCKYSDNIIHTFVVATKFQTGLHHKLTTLCKLCDCGVCNMYNSAQFHREGLPGFTSLHSWRFSVSLFYHY